MLPSLRLHPELRCKAKSRSSGWQQCSRIACTGMSVCFTHGGAASIKRKNLRFGETAPHFKHGKRSIEHITKETLDLQRVRLLQIGVAAINGSEAAGRIFDRKWWPLLERQAKEMAELQKRMNPKRKPPRRKPPEAV